MENQRKNAVKTPFRWWRNDFLKKMNLIMAGLVIGICSVSSQTKTMSAQRSSVTVQETFDAIQSRSNYTKADEQPAEGVMKQALDGQNKSLDVKENHVILSTKTVQDGKIKIKGKVTDKKGEPLIGAGVSEGETSNSAITDTEGNFELTVSPSANIRVVYVGYSTKTIPLNGRTQIEIILEEDALVLQEVVVTALGLRKKEKSLTYSTQIVGGEELTRAKDPNMITALAGKSAGVQVNKSASGLGGSAKVVIRGNRSAAGNNQPLYVIDGIPVNNNLVDQTSTSIGGTNDAANRDGGDGISNLNPDDIESMNILKGPAAAALYGSQAANGVVVITTKKGMAGQTSVTFNTNTTWEDAAYGIPEFQNHYTGVTSSWSSKINGSPDYTKDFFQTGLVTINSLALTAGSERIQTYFSYANTYGNGVVDNNRLLKHNFNFRETANFFDNKLTLDANVNLLYQKMNNRTTPGGYYMNPLIGLYHFPRGGVEGGQPMDYYREQYQIFIQSRNMYTQNWYSGFTDMDQNPYWLINKAPSDDARARTIANLTATYKILPTLTLQARGNGDFISDKSLQKMYAGTHPSLAGTNGRLISYEATNLNTYGDILLTWQGKLSENFSANASIGASITDQRIKSLLLDSRPGGLFYPNVFTIANMNLNNGYIVQEDIHRQDQSVFFSGQLSYKDWLFLDLTARNDWSSTLAFTDNENTGFFYPSVGLTYIINESLKLPQWINLAKVRGAWSQVGNALPLYISNPVNGIAAGGNFQPNTTEPFDKLKPEQTVSLEFGTEWRMFNNRLDLDVTYYKTNTTNQLFTLPAPAGSGYSFYYVNAGNIQNKGWEIVLGGTPVLGENYRWKTSFNFATNQNEVLELAEGLDYFAFGQQSSSNYQMRLEKGGSFGDIYGLKFKRDDQGKIVYDNNGIPVKDAEADLQKVANTAPKWNLGWGNTLTYKDFSLFFLIDGRFGGQVMSMTQADLDAYGVSKASGDARDNNGVQFDGKTITDVEGFYTTVGGRAGITEYYVYSATNVRLRELSLGYKLPASLLGKSGAVKACEIALIGRNLFFFKNDAPYDPDASLSTGNNLQGVDVFGMPSNRSFGVNLKLKF